ncbi:MAG: excinuclease ABC subunit B [Sulfobacillus acidophilus]|uniref:Excinuclease ABC subunit B n=1 Tax=Sulfobacillus acidophilus TaxID=53633 RepID=A0A2T2WIG7_9FIRM|nr:MAG: excinuclease ABC subunit B [Sulfobacillus acidophilus]
MSGQVVQMCQRCQTKPAQVHFSKVVNGEKSERFLCEDCAREEGAFHFVLGPQFTVQHVLGGLIGQAGLPANRSQLEGPTCPQCGYTFREFADSGRLGCDHCYATFQNELSPLILRLHGRVQHRGKFPARGAQQLQAKRELEQLREAMNEAIKREAFEEAAQIRDKIKTLEGRQTP